MERWTALAASMENLSWKIVKETEMLGYISKMIGALVGGALGIAASKFGLPEAGPEVTQWFNDALIVILSMFGVFAAPKNTN